jgi:hypothetical protein
VDTPFHEQILAILENLEETLMAVVEARIADRQTLTVSPDLLTVGDHLFKQFGCIGGFGPSRDFTDHLEDFGMIPRADTDGEHAFEVRLFVGPYVFSEVVEKSLEFTLVFVVLIDQVILFLDRQDFVRGSRFVFGGATSRNVS